jgi:hypothetical protein
MCVAKIPGKGRAPGLISHNRQVGWVGKPEVHSLGHVTAEQAHP